MELFNNCFSTSAMPIRRGMVSAEICTFKGKDKKVKTYRSHLMARVTLTYINRNKMMSC